MDVAHLLIKRHMPSESELTDFCNVIRRGAADVTPLVYKVQSLLPAEAHAAVSESYVTHKHSAGRHHRIYGTSERQFW